MALIKCPECGNNVSTSAKICPHCGFPLEEKINKNENTIETKTFPKPIDPSWTDAYRKKNSSVKATWTIIFIAVIVFLIPFAIVCFKGHGGSGLVAFVIILGLLGFISLIIMIVTLSGWKIRTRVYDGYTILVYSGTKSLLIIENNNQDTGTRFLDGYLPNGKKVHAAIAVWDAAIRIDVDSEIRSRK